MTHTVMCTPPARISRTLIIPFLLPYIYWHQKRCLLEHIGDFPTALWNFSFLRCLSPQEEKEPADSGAQLKWDTYPWYPLSIHLLKSIPETDLILASNFSPFALWNSITRGKPSCAISVLQLRFEQRNILVNRELPGGYPLAPKQGTYLLFYVTIHVLRAFGRPETFVPLEPGMLSSYVCSNTTSSHSNLVRQ